MRPPHQWSRFKPVMQAWFRVRAHSGGDASTSLTETLVIPFRRVPLCTARAAALGDIKSRYHREKCMPQYVIERKISGASKLTDEEIRQNSLKSLEVLRELGPEIYWIESFVTDDKTYCIFWSPDERLIHEHGRRLGVPVDRVAAVRRLINPVNVQ